MKRILIIFVVALLFILSGLAFYVYHMLAVKPTVPEDIEDPYVHIPTNASYEEVVALLEEKELINNRQLFDWLVERMQYRRDPMRSGRFRLEPGWSLIEMIRHLRGGPQAPVAVVLTNERLPENVAAKVARFIEPDSATILSVFNDPEVLRELGYTPETFMSLFIPNTYEVYWNTSPREFLDRMVKEHKTFWDKDQRRLKALSLDLRPDEVYTLASIVEKETLQNSEKKRMAGVYLNRLELGMPLQADPTAVFATRDFDTKRVTNYHTTFDSPYNTYMYRGLPPGPIAMASISSIDAVLNAEDHDYIFFCAKGDGSGLHSFAETLAGHNRNVAVYRENLRQRGLR